MTSEFNHPQVIEYIYIYIYIYLKAIITIHNLPILDRLSRFWKLT